jgi:hypothetical protein
MTTAAAAQSYCPLQGTAVVADRKVEARTRGKQSTGGRIEPTRSSLWREGLPAPRKSHGRGDIVGVLSLPSGIHRIAARYFRKADTISIGAYFMPQIV